MRKLVLLFLVVLVAVTFAVTFYWKAQNSDIPGHPNDNVREAFGHAYETVPAQAGAGLSGAEDVRLLTRLVAAEAEAEPYEGKVAIAAVVLNRIKHPSFPNTLNGIVYQPLAFESVANGRIWRVINLDEARRAVNDALSGWDPVYGAIYFWNPATATSKWVWSRKIVRRIGKHVFAL